VGGSGGLVAGFSFYIYIDKLSQQIREKLAEFTLQKHNFFVGFYSSQISKF
jgi:hypothetical protein